MKSMKNFTAQQLTKKQMNDVHGGQGIVECGGMKHNVECTYTHPDGSTRRVYGCANEVILAMGNAQTEIEAAGGKFEAHSCVEF